MSTAKFMPVYKATVKRDDLTVQFQRLYRDGRDQMSDCLAPQWEPLDEFIIDIEALTTWHETVSLPHRAKMDIKHSEAGERLELRGVDRNTAAKVWVLAARKNATFAEIRESLGA